MKPAVRLLCLLSVIFLAFPSGSAQAAGRVRIYGSHRFPNVKKKVVKPQYEAISAVDLAAHTVSVHYVNSASDSPKTLQVTQFTEIEVNGNKGVISDLKPGMKVTVGMGTDASVASRLVASPAPTK